MLDKIKCVLKQLLAERRWTRASSVLSCMPYACNSASPKGMEGTLKSLMAEYLRTAFPQADILAEVTIPDYGRTHDLIVDLGGKDRCAIEVKAYKYWCENDFRKDFKALKEWSDKGYGSGMLIYYSDKYSQSIYRHMQELAKDEWGGSPVEIIKSMKTASCFILTNHERKS